MNQGPTITNANPERLIHLINKAQARITYISPGIDLDVARALSRKWQELGRERVTVILDVDPEVCRLGYGTLEGLKSIKETAHEVCGVLCHQPGIRIGILIADDTTLIYSPTPLLIEAGSDNPDQPNAIELSSPPQELANDVGLGSEPDFQRIVGMDPIDPQRIDKVEEELKQNPPVKFNLARRVRTFTGYFQFVELELKNCYISRKKVPIPSALMGFANHREIEENLHTHFDLVPEGEIKVENPEDSKKPITEETIKKMRNHIERDYLIHLTGYGTVVHISNKEKLQKDFEKLNKMVKAYSEGVKKQVETTTESSKQIIIDTLMGNLRIHPPQRYAKFQGRSIPEKELLELVTAEIDRAFEKALEEIQEMKVSLMFKNVTYESLHNLHFLETARNAMPGVQYLHEEYETARAEEEPEEQCSLFPRTDFKGH
jgi:DNA-binding protein YbaB